MAWILLVRLHGEMVTVAVWLPRVFWSCCNLPSGTHLLWTSDLCRYSGAPVGRVVPGLRCGAWAGIQACLLWLPLLGGAWLGQAVLLLMAGLCGVSRDSWSFDQKPGRREVFI